MGRQATAAIQATDTPAPGTTTHRQRSIASQAKHGLVKPKKQTGRPSTYSHKVADEIIGRLCNGETLSAITKSLGITQKCVYGWCQKFEEFSKRYNEAKQFQASSMINNLIDEVSTLQNDQALAARVRSDLVKWFAAKIAPQQFGDSKRIELAGEVSVKHVHQLDPQQKLRIAEAWLMSQQDDSPGITSETSGPDLEAVGVQVVDNAEPPRVMPKRKRPALPGKAKSVDDPDAGGRWTGSNRSKNMDKK